MEERNELISRRDAAVHIRRNNGRWIEYPACLLYANAYSDDHIVCSE